MTGKVRFAQYVYVFVFNYIKYFVNLPQIFMFEHLNALYPSIVLFSNSRLSGQTIVELASVEASAAKGAAQGIATAIVWSQA